ncbi:MAG TPA: DUF4349 domain-containing protein, partial [Candidatus Wirthbacteria bacterium]|nr:DUF4349 domain-containing protein [Candidatus Wirthbacteria bacterium]
MKTNELESALQAIAKYKPIINHDHKEKFMEKIKSNQVKPERKISLPDFKDLRVWVGALAACFIVFTGWSLTKSAFGWRDKSASNEHSLLNDYYTENENQAVLSNPGSQPARSTPSMTGLTANKDSYAGYDGEMMLEGYDEAPNSSSGSNVVLPVIGTPSQQKIAKNASYVLRADQPSTKAQQLIDLVVNRYQGFVQDSKITSSEDFWYPEKEPVQTAYLLLRVPSEQFEQFREDISKLEDAVIISEYLTGQDVTSEYVDLEARIKNLQAEEEQLQLLLGKANTVDEMLKVRNQISSTRSEIERLTAQLKSLDSR